MAISADSASSGAGKKLLLLLALSSVLTEAKICWQECGRADGNYTEGCRFNSAKQTCILGRMHLVYQSNNPVIHQP